uniref:CTP_transf_like domain-containing protein n=2 Tax=Caenorhabditis japonica TaxID=281687 RepID=A0A8R1DTZ4_CAEJA
MSPVADSYNNKKTLIKATHRFQMLCAATKSSEWIRADNWECTRSTWTRTLQVLAHHKEQVQQKFGSDVNLILVVGGDVVDSFPRILPDGSNLWNASDILKIITEFGLIVLAREGSKPLDTIRSMSVLAEHADKIHVLQDEVCPSSVSSTRLRAALAANQSIKYSTPDDVVTYIKENSLYRS